jgi:hypothetical protein
MYASVKVSGRRHALDVNTVYLLGTDGNLRLEFRTLFDIAPQLLRKYVDANVQAFQTLDANTVLVLGTNGNLWLEQAPFGNMVETRVPSSPPAQAGWS